MKYKKIIIITLISIIITSFSIIEILKIFNLVDKDTDYKKLGLQIEYYNIEYCTKYGYDRLSKYKVYKLKNYYTDSMEKFENQLENNNLWTRNKFYEYIMKEFYEIKENEKIQFDRENLYYYNNKGIYAIFDIKNAKLYCYENYIFNEHKNYNEILEIKTKGYENREIYSVRGGPQNDGTDYYTYEFNKEKGNEIEETLSKSQNWKKERLDDSILDCFKYNEDVKSVENGYYHYKLVCRTSDENKKYNFTKEEATGWEIGVYDADKNILYYYWTSY